MQVGTFTLEEGMFFDVQNDIQIACRTTEGTGISQPGEADTSAVLDSGRYFRVDILLVEYASFPFALGTRIGDHAACALAGGAGTSHAEESLLVANLAASTAGAAGSRTFTGSGAVAPAIFADLVAAHRDLSFSAKNRLFEFQRNVFAQIGATLRPAAAASASTEKISKAQEVTEDFAEVLDYVGVKTAGAAVYTGVTESVVGGAFVGIGQDTVGLAALFELLLRVGIVRVAIGMELQRQFAVGTLDLLVAGFAGNPEHFVVVAFYVAGQSSLSETSWSFVAAELQHGRGRPRLHC